MKKMMIILTALAMTALLGCAAQQDYSSTASRVEAAAMRAEKAADAAASAASSADNSARRAEAAAEKAQSRFAGSMRK